MTRKVAYVRRYGDWVLLASSVAGLVIAIVAVVNVGNGIAYSAGAYLVLGSTALLLAASLVLSFHNRRPKWLTLLVSVLILLDLVGTGVAAYFLETPVLLAFMALGLLGWLVYLLLDPAEEDVSTHVAGGSLP